MKKQLYVIILVILSITLAACSTSIPTQANTTESTQTTASDITASDLVAGTLKLQDTDYAVTQSQASELLTLWLAYKEVNNSDTSANEEIVALVNQIESNMTSDQIAAIQAMGITTSDIQALADSSGASVTSTDSSTTAATSNSGQQMGGPSGSDMGGDMASSDMTTSGGTAPAASSATTSEQPVSTDLVLALVDPLTQMLSALAA